MCSLLLTVRTFTSNYYTYSGINSNDPFTLPYYSASYLNHYKPFYNKFRYYYHFMNTWWLYLSAVY
ncbi:hypothetical protein BDF21DRAFT_418408 [Thamnidium elegans]|nr:hypothetical protein BDF21DRAFT_418408 [Thamnidium elegans]